jgi:hypothetical protein
MYFQDSRRLSAIGLVCVGDVSGVIESEYGYHIIKREPLVVQYVLDNYPQFVSDSFNGQITEWTQDVIVSTTKIYDDFDVSKLYLKE